MKNFSTSKHPGSRLRLVALTDEEATDFANKNRASQGYVRMCKLARAIRSIINSEEADV